MEKHFNLSDTEFEKQFITCKLDPNIFSHEAHLRLAWINLSKYDITQAEINIQRQLQQFVKFVGAENKYNTTLTVAAIKAVFHFIQKSQSNNFKDFIVEFPQLKNDFRGLMNKHYSFDIYHTTAAKNSYLTPDLLSFD